MIQHLVDGAIHANLCEGEDAEHTKSKVAHRRVRHHLLHVWLNERDQCAINNANQRERIDPRSMLVGLSRKERCVESQQSINTHLQQHASEQNGTSGRSFHVSVR